MLPKLLVALHLVAFCSAASVSTYLPFYHTTDELNAQLSSLQETCKSFTVKEVGKGRTLTSVHFNEGSGKMKVLVFFGEHARELISAETALHMIRCICGACENPSAHLKSLAAAVKQGTELLIFPNVNPDGRKEAERGDYCYRVNSRGVDLNRNWDDHWKSIGDEDDTNPGRRAFSEWETVVLRDAAKDFRPHVFFTIHSGCLGMYTPYAYARKLPRSAEHAKEILKQLNPKYCNCHVGAAGKQLGYLCPGTSLDFMFDKLHTPYAFAFEIWDGKTFKYEDSSFAAALLEQSSGKKAVAVSHDHVLQHESAHVHDHSKIELGEKESCFIMPEARFKEQRFGESKHQESAFGSVSLRQHYTSAGRRFPDPNGLTARTCLTQFNPVQAQHYRDTISHWSQAILEVINKVKEEGVLEH